MTRARLLVRWALVASLAGGLSGCGFHLRGTFSSNIQTLAFEGGDESGVVQQIRALVAQRPPPRLVGVQDKPQVLVQWQSEQRLKTAEAQGTGGQVLVYRLTLMANYQVSVDGADPVSQSAQESRTMQYTEADALAKQNEESQIWQGLQTSLATQVLRQLDSLQRMAMRERRQPSPGAVDEPSASSPVSSPKPVSH